MWKDFIAQYSHEDLNFKSEYNDKSSKCLREIKYNRYSCMYIKYTCRNGIVLFWYVLPPSLVILTYEKFAIWHF